MVDLVMLKKICKEIGSYLMVFLLIIGFVLAALVWHLAILISYFMANSEKKSPKRH